MAPDNYIIVRIDSRCVPAIVEYVTDDNRRFSSFRTSAARFTKREATREAKRLTALPIWPGEYKIAKV